MGLHWATEFDRPLPRVLLERAALSRQLPGRAARGLAHARRSVASPVAEARTRLTARTPVGFSRLPAAR